MVSLIFVIFVVLLVLGISLPATIGIASLYGFSIANLDPKFLWSGAIRAVNSYTFLAIPMFVLAGNIMSKGSIAQQLLRVCQVFAGKNRISIGVTTLISCAFFAALSGSSVATVAAIGPITYPLMLSMGYSPSWAAAIIASGAIVGPIIPPSVIMVVYGVATTTSISDLFMGGIIPGILLTASFIIVLKVTNKGRIDTEINDRVSAAAGTYSFKEKMQVIWESKWALLMPVIVLGGIYGGIFTATEASVIACVYVLFVGFFITRDLSFSELWNATESMVRTTGGLILLVGLAQSFGYVITLNRIPQLVSDAVLSMTDNPVIILLLVNLILLVAGCFMEAAAAIVILTPILLPLAQLGGLNSLQFGVVMCVNMVIGTITPPFGLDLFVASSITKQPVHKITKECVPFIISSTAILFLITYFPALIDFIPNLTK